MLSLSKVEDSFNAIKRYEDNFKDNNVIDVETLKLVLKNISKTYVELYNNSSKIIEFGGPLKDGKSPEWSLRKGYYLHTFRETFKSLSLNHRINFLVKTAPMTLDPEKIRANLNVFIDLMREDNLPENIISQIEGINERAKSYRNVESYRKDLLSYITTIRKHKSV